jgi:hypothetical protein
VGIHSEAQLNRKFMEFAKLMNIYLNHFPKHEKFALANRIRSTAYEVYDLISEGQKRYLKKTTLTNLDVTHEKLRMQILLAHELGYFGYSDGREAEKTHDQQKEHRYLTISAMVDELGRMIGGWIQKIKDERLVDVMMMFAEMESPLGIPIGNLLSQTFALIYLNPLDHFVKRTLKVQHYVRYVDDFMLIGLSQSNCTAFRRIIVGFLRETLGLELSKSTIQKVRKGVNFCGYRTWRSKVFIRKHSLYKFRKSVRKEHQESVVSLLGHAKQTNSLGYMLKIVKEGIRNGKDLQIPKGYRRLYHTLPAGA